MRKLMDGSHTGFQHLGICLLAALGLALALLALPMNAFAESTGTLTVSSEYDHALTAYRLLSGTVSEDKLLSPSFDGAMEGSFYDSVAKLPQWSAGDDPTDPVTVREWLAASISADTDYTVAQSLAALAQESGSSGVALRTNVATSLGEGYWLVTGDDTLPFCVLVGTAPATAHEKASVPTIDKGVSTDGGSTGYHESVAAGASEKLSFRVRGTLPANYGSYDSYLYRFVDISSAGIDMDASSVHVVVSLPDGSTQDITDSFSVSYAGHTLTVSTDDLKAAYPTSTGDEHIDLLYEAILDPAKAERGYVNPNTNTATIVYSNNPTSGGTGTTEPSRTKVFTFGLTLLKVSSEGQQPLAGAEFALRDSSGRYLAEDGTWAEDEAEEAALVTGSDGRLEIGCLGPGTYELSEAKAPRGYAALGHPIEVRLVAGLDQKTFTVEATGTAATVSDIDAEEGTATLTIEDTETKVPPTPGRLPDTGDLVAGGTAVLALLAAGALLLHLSGRIRHGR